MKGQSGLDHDSSGVQKHLEMNQNIIMRMAENSRSCKVWCVTLVAAVLVLVARTGDANHALIALGPSLLFFVLDSYYLSLEQGFRDLFQRFAHDLRDGKVTSQDLFNLEEADLGPTLCNTVRAMFKSFSVWPFYLVILGTVLMAWWRIL